MQGDVEFRDLPDGALFRWQGQLHAKFGREFGRHCRTGQAFRFWPEDRVQPAPEDAAVAQPAPPIRIVVADDHAVVRSALARLLGEQPDFRVVGEAGDGAQAVEQAARLRPDVVLMDLNMPVLDGIEATRRIAADCPGVKVVGLSFHDPSYIAPAMRQAGAAAYVVKTAPEEELAAAIRAAR